MLRLKFLVLSLSISSTPYLSALPSKYNPSLTTCTIAIINPLNNIHPWVIATASLVGLSAFTLTFLHCILHVAIREILLKYKADNTTLCSPPFSGSQSYLE